MASSFGNEEDGVKSLHRLFEILRVSNKDRVALERQCGIVTIEQLFQSRAQLIYNRQYVVCLRLVAAIDYLTKKRFLLKGSTTSLDALFNATGGSDDHSKNNWEYFLALKIMQSRQHQSDPNFKKRQVEELKAAKADVTTANKSGEGEPFQKKFKQGDKYWVDTYNSAHHQEEKSDSDDDDTEAILSPEENVEWQYDKTTQDLLLKAAPHCVRIPLPLFKVLYTYQRVGIAWMATLYQNKTGGILGE